MRFYTLIFFLCVTVVKAQTYEAGVMLGGVNALSDIGSQKHLSPTDLGFGLVFKWNKSQRYAWRAGWSYVNLSFDDKKAQDPARILRNLNRNTGLLELSSGLEVNFLPYNLHRFGPAFTPYLYSGLTVFRYDYNYFEFGKAKNTNKKDISFALPIHFGIKARIGSNTILGAEIGVRYTFTDNLDGSNPINSNFATNQFGDINNNDWYVFSGISFTYTFTRKPCRDCFE